MPNHKNINKAPEEDTAPVNELDQLRQIVFGVAEQQLKKQIISTRNDMEQALNTQNINFTDRLDKMQDNISERFAEIEQKIQQRTFNSRFHTFEFNKYSDSFFFDSTRNLKKKER